MNSIIETIADGSAVRVIGWTLLHFVWQAAAIAIIVFILLMVTRTQSATARYWICCIGLLAMVASPIASVVYLGSSISTGSNHVENFVSKNNDGANDQSVSTSNSGLVNLAARSEGEDQIAIGALDAAVSMGSGNSLMGQIETRLAYWLPLWVAIWIVGVVLHFARLTCGIWRVHHWVGNASPVMVTDLNETFAKLCQCLHLHRNVRLLQSDQIGTPAVAGIIRPAVLVPASLLTGLSCREMELVLAHELAHVKRSDFLINLLQKAAESLLFYHPAVWWISHRISVERENCCDDLAVEICGDRIALAKALTAMETVRCGQQSLAPAATGGLLAQRIRRLLLLEPQPIQSAWPVGLLAILLAGICLATVPSFSSSVKAMTPPTIEVETDPVPESKAVAATGTDQPEIEKKPEVTKRDSKTQIDQRVFADIRLQAERDQQTKTALVDMKYSNVIPYTFIPARTAKALGAIKLGELDFTNFRDAKPLTGVTWLIVPNDFSNPMGYIQDGVSHYFLNYLREPTDNPIVPYKDDRLFAPDHLGFYGMNKTKQMKFDVVRIQQVDLGIGKPFGPVNALVLNDDNSDFGLFGGKWAQQVRGKHGGTLLHAAVGEFRIHPPKKQPDDNKPKQQKQDRPRAAKKSDDNVKQKDKPNLPQFEVIEQNGQLKHIAVNSINVRRTPADLVKHFSSTFDRHGARRGISITNMESIVAANPTKRFDNFVEANEVIFSLPEGSKSRAAIIGDVVEMKDTDDSVEVTVTNGKVQWIDSVGVVRAEAAPDGGAEQLVISASIGNDEVVLKMKTQRIEPSTDYPNPPVQVTMNVKTGAPDDEQQPPHGSIRYEIFEESKEENKPMRLKMKWRYDLDRLAKEAEKQTGKKWDTIIWGIDAPKLDPRR